jgi:membrane-associated phospholipid phosphatase
VIVFVTTIYLDFHWLTDSVAGVLLGLFIARLIDRVPWQLPTRQ